MTPWADAVFAIDRDWWKQYGAEVQGLACERLSMRLNRHGAKPAGIGEHGNSGAGAISLAALRGASRVILLGYDVQYTGGKRHWHGDHPRNLGNAGSIAQWPEHFELAVGQLLALLQGAVAVVGGIGWIVPASIAAGVPAWIVCGGQGGYNAPELITDPAMNTEHITFAVPDNFCRCTERSHTCDKRIANYDQRFAEWADRLPAVV